MSKMLQAMGKKPQQAMEMKLPLNFGNAWLFGLIFSLHGICRDTQKREQLPHLYSSRPLM